ncbi:MAG: antibiotic biosynthesis monooxygenase [Thermodesulfobacteriota bacterium]|jgi:heme-degrading monooxygenase HmoA
MVRVLIERRISEGLMGDFQQALRRTRLVAVQKPGYLSGESWRDADDPNRYVVISTWTSRQAWDAWAASDARRVAMGEIRPMLQEPERITVLEPV